MKPSTTPVTERILELFAGPLKAVRFPDLDAETLTNAAAALEDARLAVTTAEASLEAARRALAEKEDLLERASERALAYARVYAIERPDLRAVIDAAAEPARRGPGRPRKPRLPKDGTEANAVAAE
ncbi:hypothetical protein BH09MYX1_BH09MYX1_51420 [soil metagenome]